jgi:glycopeptide antibiotics resistance protein
MGDRAGSGQRSGAGEDCRARKRSPGATATRLGAALLLYMLGVTLIITLLPFQFGWPREWRVMLSGNVMDVAGNILLFLPLGVLFRVASSNRHRRSALHVLALGAAVSMVIEGVQLFEPERYSSPLDIASNGVGAMLGAFLQDWLAARRRLDARVVGRLSLELPLMGLLYLLVPLLWLNALGAVSAPMPWAWLALPLAAFGGTVAGGMQRHHFGPVAGISPAATAGAVSVGILLGMFPVLPAAPLAGLLASLGGGTAAWVTGRIPFVPSVANRRFEVPVLRTSAPWYGAYLALMVATPLAGGLAGWSLGVGFGGAVEWSRTAILRSLELLAAFTMLGYMVAEFRGREGRGFRAEVPRVARWGGVAAVLAETANGFRAGQGASVVEAVLAVLAAIYGAWLYHLQREHVMHLLSEQSPARATPRSLESLAAGARRGTLVEAEHANRIDTVHEKFHA